MIFIDPANRYIADFLLARSRGEKPDSRSMLLSDFVGSRYLLAAPPCDAEDSFRLSVSLTCYDALLKFGLRKRLDELFPSLLAATPEPGYDLTVAGFFSALPDSSPVRATVLRELPSLLRHCLACFLAHAHDVYRAAAEGAAATLLTLPYRAAEPIYAVVSRGRFSVTLATHFPDEADRVFARVFLQEFADSRRLNTAFNSSPQVQFSARDPPPDIRSLLPAQTPAQTPPASSASSAPVINYVTFNLFSAHLDNDDIRETTFTRLLFFRDYLHYHIKCSKVHMHSRMINRVDSFLKVLNRAKTENTEAKTEKKTISGRTFVQRK